MTNFYNPIIPALILEEMSDEEIAAWEEESRDWIPVDCSKNHYFNDWVII